MPHRENGQSSVRIGHGYDLHRLAPIGASDSIARPMILGGVAIESQLGPVAHSDGDAVCHAITDALLGALGLPDLGTTWPDTDPAHDGADSTVFLQAAVSKVRAAGYAIGNVDATIVCERPKIAPHRSALIASLATHLGCEPSQVNVKGKTHEGVDAIGEGRAIEVHAVALLVAAH